MPDLLELHSQSAVFCILGHLVVTEWMQRVSGNGHNYRALAQFAHVGLEVKRVRSAVLGERPRLKL
jgi:hypothetical protein